MAPGRAKRAREADTDDLDEAGTSTSALTALHRNRLVPWSVAPVTAIAACPDGSAIAAGYEDGKVEVWDVTYYNRLVCIPGEDGAELSSLAWAQDSLSKQWRLFASRLDGQIQELNCRAVQAQHSTDSYGGAVWSLAAEPLTAVQPGFPQHIAAACDDGSIRLFAVEGGEPGLQYVRTLAQAEGRALSVAWHPNGRILVSGSSDGCIHCWEAATGHEVLRITAGTQSNAPPCVWSLLVLPDGTIVSGDSDGATQFWDGRFGTLLMRFQQHFADVLTLAAAPDGKMVFASGVDPRVAAYHLVADKATGGTKWVYLDSKAPHTHDVRALGVLAGSEEAWLLSGGNDGHLVLYSVPRFLKESASKMSKSPQRPMFCLSRQRHMLSAQQHHLDVWQLGQVASKALMRQASQQQGGDEKDGDPLDLSAAPCHLARITTSASQHLVCAAMSADGNTIACSDAARVRAFRLTSQQQQMQQGQQQAPQQQAAPSGLHVQRVRLSASVPPAICMAFGPEGSQLYSADGSGRIHCIQLEDGTVSASTSTAAATATATTAGRRGATAAATTAGHTCLPSVTHMAVSPSGEWLAAAMGTGSVQLYRLPGLQPAGALMLVEEPAAAVAGLEFSPDSKTVAVATVADTLCAYDVASRAPSQWTLQNHAAVRQLLDVLPNCPLGLAFNPSGEGLVVFSAGGMCHLNLSKPVSTAHLSFKRQRTAAPPPEGGAVREVASAVGLNGRVISLADPCLFFGYFGSNMAVLVEKPWQEVLSDLPPPLYRHRYGS